MSELAEFPDVSIVIPVRNEAEGIMRTIDSCLDQQYGGTIEIVVADAMSNDRTRDALNALASSGKIIVVDNPALTTPRGLNAAIGAASGEVIVRCDGHSILPADYVARALHTLVATGAANVGGVQKAIGTSPMQRGIARAMTNPVGVGDAQFHRSGTEGETDTVYLGVFRMDALEQVGLFDETLDRNQDYELNVRLREAGLTVWFDPALEVEYTPRSSLRSLWRQYFDYGKWKRKVLRMHPGSLRARQAGPPVLVLLIAASLVSLVTPVRVLGLAFLGLYLGLLALTSLYEALRTRDAAGLLTGAAIGTMHVAWGTGFLTGRL
jgi:succinoglycan biosynthesis protein ExoA